MELQKGKSLSKFQRIVVKRKFPIFKITVTQVTGKNCFYRCLNPRNIFENKSAPAFLPAA